MQNSQANPATSLGPLKMILTLQQILEMENFSALVATLEIMQVFVSLLGKAKAK